jgi:hypothetical protein
VDCAWRGPGAPPGDLVSGQFKSIVVSAPCHPLAQAELEQGLPVVCWRSGRTIPAAYAHMHSVMTSMVQEANAWTDSQFSSSAELQEVQAAIRMARGLALRKFDFLLRVPWLLGSLGEAGVKEEVLRQWAEVPAERHDPVTQEFLKEGSILREQIDGLPADGLPCSDLPEPLRRRMGDRSVMALSSSFAE